jgi:hypothetical protein
LVRRAVFGGVLVASARTKLRDSLDMISRDTSNSSTTLSGILYTSLDKVFPMPSSGVKAAE